jgi:hypothetical protein
LTIEDRAALNWIKAARERRGDKRRDLNDIVVDGIWLLAEKEGKTMAEILATLPPPLVPSLPLQRNVTEMPKNH